MCDIETVPASQAEDLHQVYEPFIEALSREVDAKVLKSNCDSIANQLIRPGWRQYLILARQQLPPQPPDLPPLPLAEILLETRNSQILERMARIRTLAGMNKLTSAMEEAFSILEVAPNYLPLQIQIGELLLKEGRTQDAVDKFLLVADLYNLRGEAAQAIRLYHRIIQIAPMDLTVRSKMIELLVAQGRSEDAVKEYLNLGELYYSAGGAGPGAPVLRHCDEGGPAGTPAHSRNNPGVVQDYRHRRSAAGFAQRTARIRANPDHRPGRGYSPHQPCGPKLPHGAG